MRKKKNKRGGSRRKLSAGQMVAYDAVNEWVQLGRSPAAAVTVDGFELRTIFPKFSDKALFELHCHSTCSDGFLSPSKLVARAHANGVNVLALTDHDTMSGIPEALDAAHRFGIKIIPGVEISTIFSPSGESVTEEPVHVLAYYGGLGPVRFDELETFLSSIREGRVIRAKDIVSKLNRLGLPLKWERVARIAGKGVAPGRLHVACAMVEAGLVENSKQAFARYLHDGGPAYSTGSEPCAEDAVRFICKTQGVAVLAHPWSLKNPLPIIRQLKSAGLHGLEVYRSDGKLAAFSELADEYGLVKMGGSDYHGRRREAESELGSANLPMVALHEFLKVARPIWCSAIGNILRSYTEETLDMKPEQLLTFIKIGSFNGFQQHPVRCWKESIDCCLAAWLTTEEQQSQEVEALCLNVSSIMVSGNE